jgi:hypothetical protein
VRFAPPRVVPLDVALAVEDRARVVVPALRATDTRALLLPVFLPMEARLSREGDGRQEAGTPRPGGSTPGPPSAGST